MPTNSWWKIRVRELISECDAVWQHGMAETCAMPYRLSRSGSYTAQKRTKEALGRTGRRLVKELFNEEYKGLEKDIEFFMEDTATPKTKFPPSDTGTILVDAIYACHKLRDKIYPDDTRTSWRHHSTFAIINIGDSRLPSRYWPEVQARV